MRPSVPDLAFSSYVGGTSYEDPAGGIALGLDKKDRAKHAYVAGRTGSADFPVTPEEAFQQTNAGGQDGFIANILLRADGGR